jgi:protein-tyrosine phosphatase
MRTGWFFRGILCAVLLGTLPNAALRAQGPAAAGHERLVALDHGSNFRDIGGYAAQDGKHVRWGMIYRSAATPLLTPADVARLKALGLANLVDLRSDEERLLAPTRLDGIPYSAVGYSMATMMSPSGGFDMKGIYRNFPTLLAPQLRIIFRDLIRTREPIAYNCSAGQDRTGFATAMILSALGVPRDVIYQDYLLSTGYRHPEYELPHIDPALAATSPVASFLAKMQQDPRYAKPNPLYGADKVPFLTYSFDEIDTKWGSVDNYLRQEVGLTAQDLERLRTLYLE